MASSADLDVKLSIPSLYSTVLACVLRFGRKQSIFMQSQDATDAFLLKWWPQIEANKDKIIGVAAIAAVVAVVVSFISWRHQENQIAAGDAMTQTLLTLPANGNPTQAADAFLQIADQYRSTPAGERSLLEGAGALFGEGKYEDAQSYFQQYLNAHPDDEFSGQAALGVARCLEAEGKLNDAAGEYQHVINDFPDAEAVNAAKFSLAEIDLQQHNYPGALDLFQQVAQSDPYSALGNEAAQYVMNLRSAASSAATTQTTSPVVTPAAPTPSAAPAPAAPFNLSH
jgi:TolA-binding protein